MRDRLELGVHIRRRCSSHRITPSWVGAWAAHDAEHVVPRLFVRNLVQALCLPLAPLDSRLVGRALFTACVGRPLHAFIELSQVIRPSCRQRPERPRPGAAHTSLSSASAASGRRG
jgi:hypothetical protein